MGATVQSVERAAGILRLLAREREPLPLARIADELGLAKGTLHGLLHTLLEVGLVEQDETTGPYRLSPDALGLHAVRLDPNELRARALNWSDALAARTGHAVRVATFHEGRAVVAHHVFSGGRSRQVLLTGSPVVLHADALGKVLLAGDPAASRRVLAAPLEALTTRTITDPTALLRALATARDLGWAASVEEVERGVASLAAPIRDDEGLVVAAVGISGSVEALTDGRQRPRTPLVDRVVEAARSISRELGHGRSW